MSGRNRFLYLLFILLLVSCSKDNWEQGDKLPKKKDTELMEAMEKLMGKEFDTFYAKISTKYSDSTQNVSFKTSVRIKKDSVINATMSFAGIPIVNSIILLDSIHMTNKKDKCYIKESLAYIKESFGVDFSHQNIEQLFLGQPVAFDPSKKYYKTDDPYSYTLCSHKKKDIRRNEKSDVREIVMYYTLSDDLSSLDRIQVDSPGDSTTIVIDYSERKLQKEMSIPTKADIHIFTPRQEIEISLHYKKTRINEEEQIHFIIPENYEKCK